MALTRPRASQINTVITNVTDPLIVLNNGSTTANIDVGLVMNRDNGTLPNVAFFWDESANSFVTSFTTSTGITNANVSIGEYANIRVNTLTGDIVSTLGNIASLTSGNLTLPGTLTLGAQIFYTQGNDGFSVNEDFNIGNATITGYHYTSGTSRNSVAFTLARTGQFTNGFGIHGTSSDNKFVIGSEFANSTFQFKKSIGMPFNVAGGTTLFEILPTGNLTVYGSILPSANVTYDLGSPTQRFRDGYFSGNTIYIGSEQMGVDADGNWSFTSNGATVSLGSTTEFNPPNANISGNVTATNYLFSNGVNLMSMVNSEFGNVWANAAAQSGNLAVLWQNGLDITSNIVALDNYTSTLSTRILDAEGNILTANSAMKGYVDSSISTLLSDTGVLEGNIISIYANLSSVAGSLATLTSNAGAQAGAISSLTSNSVSQASNISNLYTIKANVDTPTFTGNVTFDSIGAVQLPSGTSDQRTLGTAGQIRYNSETGSFEGYTTSWGSLGGAGGGGTPGGADTYVQFNDSGTTFAGASALKYFKGNGVILANADVVSTSSTTGTMQIIGGLGSTGNATLEGILTVGSENMTNVVEFTDTIAAFYHNANSWAQVTLQNLNSDIGSSSDFIAYANNGDNTSGWIDMGITGNNFVNQGGEYGITGPNDGYIFMAGKDGANTGGNLVIATSGYGTHNDIVIATGGFDSIHEEARFVAHVGLKLVQGTPSTNATSGALQVVGGVGIGGNLNIQGDATIQGNLNIVGNVIRFETNSLSITDSLLYLAEDNSSDFLDLGLVGSFTKDSYYQHGGIVRDATDGIWKFFANVDSEPTTTVDFGSATYSPIKAGNIFATGNLVVGSNIRVTGALLNSAGEAGIPGQYLTTTGTGLAWTDIEAGALYTAANTAPSSPAVNDVWYDTETGILFQYQDDGDTEQWVDISSVALNTNVATVAGTSLSISGNGTVGGTFASADTITVNSANSPTAIANGGTNGVGNIGSSGSAFNTIFAKATSAQYADLAERYTCDQQYYPGTVLIFGGSEEVTMSTQSHDPRVAGVVTTHPAYLMNDSIQGVDIALTGRVPCRVLGPINKGDRLVSSNIPGVAQRLDPEQYVPGCVIGKSLEELGTNSVTTIEVAVGRF